MLDLARYEEWNPFVVRATLDGELRLGAELALEVVWATGGGARSRERITRIDPPACSDGDVTCAVFAYEFIGPLRTFGLVHALRTQALEAHGGTTRYVTSEVFSGLLVRALPLAKVQRGFELHAEALKTRAESLRTP